MCSRMYSCDCAYISQVDKDSRSFSRKRCMCLSFRRNICLVSVSSRTLLKRSTFAWKFWQEKLHNLTFCNGLNEYVSFLSFLISKYFHTHTHLHIMCYIIVSNRARTDLLSYNLGVANIYTNNVSNIYTRYYWWIRSPQTTPAWLTSVPCLHWNW